MIKSSVSSEPVPPSLQLTGPRMGSVILQVPEQLPGSVIGTSTVHVGSLASTIVTMTLPPPAEPACNWKFVARP